MDLLSVIEAIIHTDKSYQSLIARIASGAIILPYGLLKLGFNNGVGVQGTLEDFRRRKLPVFIGWLVIISQSLGSVALLTGFFSRIAAAGAIIIFTGAFFVHLPDGWMLNWYMKKKGEGVEYFVLLLALLWIVLIYGSGFFSLDLLLYNSI